MLIPVILSGGAGTRLWPVSRTAWPKPFMRLPDGNNLLHQACTRAALVAHAPDRRRRRPSSPNPRGVMPSNDHSRLTVPPEAPDAVAAGLRQLAALGAHERRAMGVRGRQYVRAHHSYAVLAQRFIEAVT